jgi:hypothetical protein
MAIHWICEECAILGGGRLPPGHLSTWHIGKCDVCDHKKPITEPRDFGYPKIIKNRRLHFAQSLNGCDNE